MPVSIVAVALGLAGYSSPESGHAIAECGNIHFPDNAHILYQKGEQEFSGEAQVEIVAEFPATELEQFTSASQLGAFTAGVPSNWQKHY
ncbi:hypothetical protein [Nocardia higoensis]|uniref:hypothetical protein n=1 Tax=Nocardia higoensis TaxID=228599 RepID=UPI0003034385|nr:hypothetical protein [Nocardia higoensis]